MAKASGRRSAKRPAKDGTGKQRQRAEAGVAARVTPAVAKLIWSKGAGLCAFPGCRKSLSVEATAADPAALIGEIAHVVAHSGDGPRAEFDPPGGNRDGEPNLVLMCPTHHAEIDRQPKTWTVEQLVGCKETHERWVRESLSVQEAGADPGPMVQETVHSSLLPVAAIPRYVYLAPCTMTEPVVRECIDVPEGSAIALPFIVRAGRLITFNDLTASDTPFRRAFDGKAERQDATAWWGDPDYSNWYVTLLNRTLNKLTGRRELNLDKDHHRYFFDVTRDDEDKPATRTVTYQSLNRKATTKKVAWRPKRKSTGQVRNYWIHLAVGLRFHRVTKTEWVLSVRPERRYTTDGVQTLGGKSTGRRATSTKSHMYNYGVLAELQFWKEYLSNGHPAMILDFGGQSLVVDAQLLSGTADWPGVQGDTKAFANVVREFDLFTSHEYHQAIDGTSHPDIELPFNELDDLLEMEGADDDDVPRSEE